jgi:biotin operon repressor
MPVDTWQLPPVTHTFKSYKLHPEQVVTALELLEHKPVRERAAQVYRYLVKAATKFTKVYLKQQTIADVLGVCRKTVSRAVRELKDAGLLLVLRPTRRGPALSVVPGAAFPILADPGKRWLEPMSHLISKGAAPRTDGDSYVASLLQNPGAAGAGRKTPTTIKTNRIRRCVRKAKEKVMEYTPRPLPPRTRKAPRRYEDELQSLQDLVSEEFFGERYDSPAQEPSEPKPEKPVKNWRADDLVRHWLSVLREQKWCRNKVDHTSIGGLGKVFKMYLEAEHSPQALKECADRFLTEEYWHNNAKFPWRYFRMKLPDLLEAVADEQETQGYKLKW